MYLSSLPDKKGLDIYIVLIIVAIEGNILLYLKFVLKK